MVSQFGTGSNRNKVFKTNLLKMEISYLSNLTYTVTPSPQSYNYL